MEVNPILFWNGLLTLVTVMDALQRLEDKLDKILIGSK